MQIIREVREILSEAYNSQIFSATSYGSAILDDSQGDQSPVPSGSDGNFVSSELFCPKDDTVSEG